MLSLILAVACPSALPTEVSAFAGTRKYTIPVDTMGTVLPVALPVDSIWQLLPRVYEKLGLPLDEKGTAGMRFGTCWKRVRGRVAGSALSRYLDCGEIRQMPNADANDVDGSDLLSTRVSGLGLGVAIDAAGQRRPNEAVWPQGDDQSLVAIPGEGDHRFRRLVLRGPRLRGAARPL